MPPKFADPHFVSHDAVAMASWGKDHWALLGYVNSVTQSMTSGVKVLKRQQLRIHPERHPLIAHLSHWRESWGTRLAGYFDFQERGDLAKAVAAGVQMPHHDDWDCMLDLESEGLVEIVSAVNLGVMLTPRGAAVAAQLAAHKAHGGQFADFKVAEAVQHVTA